MTATYTVTEANGSFTLTKDGKPVLTPDKQPLAVPSRALAEAIAAEWQAHGKFAAGKMPLTTLAQTAIDRIHAQMELIVESLLTYVDTDALVYHSSSSQKLTKTQEQQWNPVLDWSATILKAKWQTTSGVMPVDQSEALHSAIRTWLEGLSSMHMAAACMLAATFSSLALAMAVTENHITAEEAFRLSRLEEESQAEIWGRDLEADKRSAKMQEEILAAGRFLGLLNHA
jgi:chaperone required for assembly of F1-ATPase